MFLHCLLKTCSLWIWWFWWRGTNYCETSLNEMSILTNYIDRQSFMLTLLMIIQNWTEFRCFEGIQCRKIVQKWVLEQRDLANSGSSKVCWLFLEVTDRMSQPLFLALCFYPFFLYLPITCIFIECVINSNYILLKITGMKSLYSQDNETFTNCIEIGVQACVGVYNYANYRINILKY